MPIRLYRCPVCDHEVKTFKDAPECDHGHSLGGHGPGHYVKMVEVLTAPSAMFKEPRDDVSKEMGKSVMKGQNQILKERSRNHARDNEISELVATNDPNIAKANKWINEKGQIRKKIDDR